MVQSNLKELSAVATASRPVPAQVILELLSSCPLNLTRSISSVLASSSILHFTTWNNKHDCKMQALRSKYSSIRHIRHRKGPEKSCWISHMPDTTVWEKLIIRMSVCIGWFLCIKLYRFDKKYHSYYRTPLQGSHLKMSNKFQENFKTFQEIFIFFQDSQWYFQLHCQERLTCI